MNNKISILTLGICALMLNISCNFNKTEKIKGETNVAVDDSGELENKITNNLTGNVSTDFFNMPEDKRLTTIINDSITCVTQPYFKYHENGKAGREIKLVFKENTYTGKLKVALTSKKNKKRYVLDLVKEVDEYSLLLEEGLSVNQDDVIDISIKIGDTSISKKITVPKKRLWTVYLYPHSHIDIGYTNTQKNCEIIHTRNLVNGIKLGEKTANYPKGSQYLWNPEGLWPVERYLNKASEEEKKMIIEGVQKGYLRLDAGYANIMTSDTNGEELIEYLKFGKKYEKLTGKPIETLVQVDVPGMTWGVVPVASKMGIKYCLSFNNGYDRVGRSTLHSFKPFWWSDVTGKNKMLFLQAGSYNPGALIKGHKFWPKMAGQTDPSKLLQIVKTENPRENFVEPYINKILPQLEASDYYPYDIFVMSWAMADNTPIDADLPDAVKSWNEEYAYPKLVIAGATDILKTFERKYGDDLPELKGDFTEHWTDGLGTAARQTAINRETKERLLQAETLWTMLKPTIPVNREKFDEAWRNVILGTEHTWCYMVPDQQPLSGEILDVKFDHFEKSKKFSQELLLEALDAVAKKDSEVFGVFNTLSWNRSGVVKVPAGQSKNYNSVLNEKGVFVESQKLSTGELLFYVKNIPAYGTKKYRLTRTDKKASEILAKENVLDNGIVKVTIDNETGDISSIVRDGEEFVKQGSGFSVNNYKYLKGNDSPDKAFGTSNSAYSIKENGPLVATIVVESDAEGANKLIREVTVIKNEPYIEINNIVDKIDIKDKEGVHFGFAFNMKNPKMVADIPWGKIEIDKEQLLGANRNWITVRRWVDISEGTKSVAWTSLDVPVFEVGDIRANIIGSASESKEWVPKLEPNGIIYSWAMNNHWHTNFQLSQKGRHSFKYAILPYNTESNIALANHFGNEQFQPLVVSAIEKGVDETSLLEIIGNPLVFSTVFKTSEDGKSALIRLRSLSDRDELVDLDWKSKKPSGVYSYNMRNGNQGEHLKGKITVPALDFLTLKVVW
ncbi:glycoside hydrolase family 38 C-terminal domain-containing protein [Flavivirga spongiicola]|uniref:Glycosyl hydrolase n=1 Tax=Flavivirga spongiicola TaxID=421621 RepID=A0ABU7XQ31_9FLAO|nr:glycoside hydrolase family 38 C-terminal domain-containing protein [Flavivirga sp. MEBiC05379]MDO5977885.1 glycoside hydrolase family 38 C-terminal domain-containing protein [Flavivirga sp. MEBiC05379]